MMKREDFDYLPNGNKFKFWDCTTNFSKIYYVTKGSNARDDNPGTKDAPFATINKAAQILMPGEKVIIGGGVYDEFVRPARGGGGPDKMISYEAAPGEKVVVSGARVFKNGWKENDEWNAIGWSLHPVSDHVDTFAKIYEGSFKRDDFDLVNPFAMINAPSYTFGACTFWFHYMPEEADWQPFFRRRGLLFCDGEPLQQVSYITQLSQQDGTYWVEDSGYKIFVRLKGDGNPKDHVITYTSRDQLFAPAVPYTSYVRVKGLEFEFAGNGYPGSQKGALSTFCGHHWIIEDNKVRWANGTGIDFGQESVFRRYDVIQGGTVVRRNHVSFCGVCGIASVCGVPGSNTGNDDILLEYNTLENNCWLDVEHNWESGAIKVHRVRNGLVRFNVIKSNWYGPGIWTDSGNINERICGNVVLGVKRTMMGGIFVEVSDEENLVDHNIVYGVGRHPLSMHGGGGHGLYEHDSDLLRIERNISLENEGSGVFLTNSSLTRICYGHCPMGVENKVLQNIIANTDRAIVVPSEKNFMDGNIIGWTKEVSPIHIQKVNEMVERMDTRGARKYHGWEKNGKVCEIDYKIDPDKMTLELTFAVHDKKLNQSYDMTKPFDLQPVFDFIKNLDTTEYELMPPYFIKKQWDY
jgi:hypothetical protein